MGGFFKGSQPKPTPAFGEQDRPFAEQAKGTIQGLFGSTGPNAQQQQASDILQSFNPQSFMSGVQGYLGQGAGALGQAQNAVTGGGVPGAQSLLSSLLGGGALDVTGGAYANRNQAIANQTQQFLNQNLGKIDSAAQAASGGVGAGSTGVAQRGRAINQAGNDLGNTLAQLSAQDLQNAQARQMSALTQALQLPFQQANALAGIGQGYQGLGSIFGQAGTAAGQQTLGQAGALGNLGSLFMGQQNIPLDYMLSYLSAARQGAGQAAGPSPFASMLQGVGQLGQGLGSIMATGGASLGASPASGYNPMLQRT